MKMNNSIKLKVKPHNIGRSLDNCKTCSNFIKLTDDFLVVCNRVGDRNVVVIPAPAFYIEGLENGVMAVRCNELF